MKKLLFCSCVVLAILGCGGADDDLPILFEKSGHSSLSSSSIEYSSSSGGSSSSSESSSSSGGSSSSNISSSSSSSSSISIEYGDDVTHGDAVYKTVVIGPQIWFQKNLNSGEGVDWETAVAACPSGWNLPTADDWNKLMRYVDKSSSSISIEDGVVASETAGLSLGLYGFMELPGGIGNLWSATEDEDFAFHLSSLPEDDNVIYWRSDPKSLPFSVRCFKNKE